MGLANGIRALNLTHTGELGYVLYIPNEFALHVYTKLMEAGQKYGIKHCGYYAMRTLRVEKFFAFWGQDLDTFTTPLECGRMWRVKFNVIRILFELRTSKSCHQTISERSQLHRTGCAVGAAGQGSRADVHPAVDQRSRP